MLQSSRNTLLPASGTTGPEGKTHCQPVVMAIDAAHPRRGEAEAFIAEGFARNHGARISSFMPCLVTLGDTDIRASLGVRPAKQSLFLEQYLDQPIECTTPELDLPRGQIAEIGNLVSQSRHYTLRLFMVTIIAINKCGFRKVVFCATRKVATILRRAGATLTPIVEADGCRLGNSLGEWGRYYETQPTLMHLDVASVVALIESSPLLMRQCRGLDQGIDGISSIIKKVS